MKITEIKTLDTPGLEPYLNLTDTSRTAPEGQGVIIVESPKVIGRALESGLQPVSLLCEEKHIAGDAASIIASRPEMPVFTGSREILKELTGYVLTRGVLCAMKRPELPAPDTILGEARRVCVIYDVCDATNVGVIFRTAAALGFDGIIVSEQSCDPFNRRAARVSMGAVFGVPWTYVKNIPETLRQYGIKSISMALTPGSVFLQDFKVEEKGKYALLLGSEGYGLPADIIEGTDFKVKIPMHYGIDSLNVGAAAAIALWHFRP